MNTDLVFRIAALGVLMAVLGQLLSRAGRDDMAMLTTIAGLVVATLMVVNLVSEFFGSVRNIFQLY